MKHKKISLAIAAAVVAGGMGMSDAIAAGPIRGAQVFDARQVDTGAAAGHRFVVKYRKGTAEFVDARSKALGLQSAIRRAGLDRALAASKTSAGRAAVSAQVLRKMAAPGWNVIRTSRNLTADEAQSFLHQLQADPAVESVSIDRLYQHMAIEGPTAVPNDPKYAEYQWNLKDPVAGVGAEQAWDISTGEGVVVAVVDTGVVENTLDLTGNILPGYDMITDPYLSHRPTADRVPGGWDLGDYVTADYCVPLGSPSHPADVSSWHGSHVSGTIAQETNNGSGLAGIAHGAKVVPVRVLGSCGGYGSDIADGIVWAAGGQVEGLPLNENPAEVINMSLGSTGPAACPAYYQDAIDEANALGSIIVVAAGNSNGDAGTYTMSSCDGVISVGATGITGGRASYSNYGVRVDLAAPGGNGEAPPDGYIWQVTNGGEQAPEPDNWVLRGMAGTSMASPHVAAAVALVQSVVETPLTWQQMRDLLESTARPFPVAIPTSTPIGAGILDLPALLEAATATPCDPATEQCAPVATPLTNRVSVAALSGSAGSETLYSIEVPAGAAGPLSIMTLGGSGDVNVLVSFGEEPTANDADYTSTRPGNNETVRIAAPQAGTYYVKLVGARAYGNVTLQARY